MINTEYILNVEFNKVTEAEGTLLHSNKYDQLTLINNGINKKSRVIFYCPFNLTFTIIEDYKSKSILDNLRSFDKENFFIVQIDCDNDLNEEILKMQFKSEFDNIHKMFDLKLDYCFSPVDELLCFNLSVLTNIDYDDIEKFSIQILFSEFGLYIINKDCCESILEIFVNKFNFKEIKNDEFFKKSKDNIEGITINNTNLAFKQFTSHSIKKQRNNKKNLTVKRNSKFRSTFELYELNSTEKLKVPIDTIEKINSGEETLALPKSSSNRDLRSKEDTYFDGVVVDKVIGSQNSSQQVYNFSTDDLIYYLLSYSLNKLEEYSEYLIQEGESLREMYLELSEKERKDFFRRIHNMEVSLQLILQETLIKKKFLKYSKAHFKVYNKLSNNFYFKNTFNFFIELMISKVTQLEIIFEKLENTIKMIKDNYSIIIEDNTEKQNVKLNSLMKVLAIITTVYAPLNIIPNMFGMNVKVPWQDEDSLWPFFGIFMFAISLVIIELIVFRRLKWL